MSLVIGNEAKETKDVSASREKQSGFTLVEVLVALFILAIGLLGLAGLQIKGISGSKSALFNSQATVCAQDIIDRMSANRNAAAQNPSPYQIELGAAPSLSLPVTILDDLTSWQNLLSNLPEGQGSITISVPGTGRVRATVLIQWNEKGDPQTFSIETLL
jgi:type IV pilus assembly protein PilV